jgi:hypothetical protein
MTKEICEIGASSWFYYKEIILLVFHLAIETSFPTADHV